MSGAAQFWYGGAPEAQQLAGFPSSGSAAMSSFAVTASGLVTFTATASAAMSPFATTGSGINGFNATGSAAMSSFAASAAGAESFAASGSAALSPFATTSVGAETFTGSGAAACSRFAVSSIGVESFDCAGTAAASPFGCNAAASIDMTYTCAGDVALSPFGVTGAGGLAFVGVGAASLSPFGASGVGFFGTIFIPVPLGYRLIARVPPAGGSTPRPFPAKDADSYRRYYWDWSNFAHIEHSSVVGFALAVDDPALVIGANAYEGSWVMVWISGGVEGETYTVTCRITLADGTVEDDSRTLTVEQH